MKDKLEWYAINLGDAILATTALYELQDQLDKVYQDSDRCEAMQAYYRYESGNTHCKVNVYLTAHFQQALCVKGALPCMAPLYSDLTFLAGNKTP
ncbi:hypothetical protein [Thalassotalea piscium]|uniref:Uncharacterized protein n=1 Tax=Thalassotalea piscium TaxID=1230533 RepID=A0A7X0TV80_9GAMM|nr:hypothetical protein [Thalassotalea piscium]MBB6544978.1 hypothetical protein [Thalassotalea piscium]